MIYSKAPFRVSFGGGGSDVAPYCWEHGGAVVNTTIDKFARARLVPNDGQIVLRSVDFGTAEQFNTGTRLEYSGGDLDLIKAVVNQFETPNGFELTTETDLPAGSGMGGSSSVAVAVIGAIAAFTGVSMDSHDVAELAYYAEREDLGVSGGYQDQYAAAFGGLNHTSFQDHDTTVTPLSLSEDLRHMLEARSLLFYTGETHDSNEIHEEMDEQYRESPVDERERRDRLKTVAQEMQQALNRADLTEFGELLHRGWEVKQQLSDRITNPRINEIYSTARENGALGGKILGAGGGGHLLLFTEPGSTFNVKQALNKYSLQSVNVSFDTDGLQTWGHGESL